ncbi:MAG TPA: beta-phosphoglucomutase [Bacillota bacterium]|nr:beta-phosphoglucomutase [Bacillota bacterium]
MKTQLGAVLFDLDGVIVNTAKYHYLAWKKLADQEEIYFDEAINERLKGVSRMASLEIILERSQKSYSSAQKEAFAETKNNWYLDMIQQLTPTEILPGVIEFLSSLLRDSIKSAVCSASKSAAFIIEKLELTKYFNTIVGGKDVKNSKPDPEVFLVGSERLEIPPAECLVIEDAAAGIEAAKRAGMKSLGIGSRVILANADMVYHDMTEFTLNDVKLLFE